MLIIHLNPKQKRFLPKAPSVNYGKVGAGMAQYRAAQARQMLKRTSSTPGRTSSQTGEHIRAALGADRENRNVRHIMDEAQDDGDEERLGTDELRKKLVTVMHDPAPRTYSIESREQDDCAILDCTLISIFCKTLFPTLLLCET
jgi:hypothetical protein